MPGLDWKRLYLKRHEKQGQVSTKTELIGATAEWSGLAGIQPRVAGHG